MDSSQIKVEWLKCHRDVCYFTETYVQIFNAHSKSGAGSGAATGAWIPFRLWPAQRQVLRDFVVHPYTIVLKARQLGMSWLTLSYALWLMLFHPAANIMLMSKRDDESIELLANRLIEMHARLPEWLQAKRVLQESAHDFVLSNGSRAKAFPTSGGRSYTGTLVLLDEADFLPDLTKVLNAIKPAIDAGGHLIMISTVDKERPLSTFKELFRDAWYHKGTNYHPIFLPWSARPGRTQIWYDQITVDMRKQSGGTDDGLWQEYPATPEQALAPLQLAKRIPFAWLEQCRGSRQPQTGQADLPAVPGLTVYVPPVPGHHYLIGADPAEGNPTSDDSAGAVLDADTWEEVATFAGKWEPVVFGGYIDQVGAWYNDAAVMPERNNHGHALILALRGTGKLHVLRGHSADAEKEVSTERLGWLDNLKGKTLLYDTLAQCLMDHSVTLNDPLSISQLASLEAATLRAPDGLPDDHADAIALAVVALQYRDFTGAPAVIIPAPDPLQAYDRSTSW